MKRRLNVTIDEQTYNRLCIIQADCGYSTVCRLVSRMLTLMAFWAEKKSDSMDICDEVDSMFGELADHESPVYGERCRRHNRRDRYGKG